MNQWFCLHFVHLAAKLVNFAIHQSLSLSRQSYVYSSTISPTKLLWCAYFLLKNYPNYIWFKLSKIYMLVYNVFKAFHQKDWINSFLGFKYWPPPWLNYRSRCFQLESEIKFQIQPWFHHFGFKSLFDERCWQN